MANLNRISKEYETIIQELKPKEVEAYIEGINSKIFECYPTITNVDVNEKVFKLSDNLNETLDSLKDKYPNVMAYKYANKYEILNKKYINEILLGYYTIYKLKLAIITSLIIDNVKSIEFLLDMMYLYFEYRTHIGAGVFTTELGLTYEDVEAIEEAFYNPDNTSYYGATAEDSINKFIEIKTGVLENYISTFYSFYSELTFNPEDVSEEVAEVLTEYNELYSKGVEFIELFEEIKANPFKNVIKYYMKAEEKVDSDSSLAVRKDYKKIYEHKLANAPSYNFQEFKLDLPTKEGSVN